MLGRWYSWLWFHSEWYLTPIDRRPFTFILRDIIYNNVGWAVTFIILFYASMIVLSFWHGMASTITTSIASFVLAHLVWGSKWIENEQEWPTYLGNIEVYEVTDND